MNRSSVYKSLKPSQRALDDEVLAQQIKAIQLKHKGCYGVDRMTGELRRKGIYVNHKRVARVMKLYKLNAIIRKKRNYFCDVERVPRKGWIFAVIGPRVLTDWDSAVLTGWDRDFRRAS